MEGGVVQIVLNAAGGLALFLLAMSMMTDGLKVFGGQKLKLLLRDWTSSAARGVFTGALVTAVVQSSSAVTVATIGFVNAGVLSLRQSLGVIFGSNVGTTMTGWLVSLVGFGFKIEAFALPILAIGVAARLIAPGKRIQGLGNALAGFGLFFLGLAILKSAFAGVADAFGDDAFSGASGVGGLMLFLGVGFLATVLTQSSSAAIAIILTAATQSVISLEAAAAAIIGANIGTTSTALLAVVGATPNAKRVAAGHLVFNVATGVIALVILPGVLAALAYFTTVFGMSGQPAPLLALFHSVFNLLGVALMLPFTARLARRLDRLFRSEEEDLSRPQHLDKTVLATPALALSAVRRELLRFRDIVCELATIALDRQGAKRERTRRRSEAALSLSEAIAAFTTSIRMENLPRAIAEELPGALRTSRYLEEVARLAPEIEALRDDIAKIRHEPTRSSVETTLDTADGLVRSCWTCGETDQDLEVLTSASAQFEARYQETKALLLSAAATHVIGVELAETLLDSLSRTRRSMDQLTKASRYLSAPDPDQEVDQARESSDDPEPEPAGEAKP
ncbi:MAG: hypothetical protein Kilf2KO_34030 [Rhodospirillales bacterium]